MHRSLSHCAYSVFFKFLFLANFGCFTFKFTVFIFFFKHGLICRLFISSSEIFISDAMFYISKSCLFHIFHFSPNYDNKMFPFTSQRMDVSYLKQVSQCACLLVLSYLPFYVCSYSLVFLLAKSHIFLFLFLFYLNHWMIFVVFTLSSALYFCCVPLNDVGICSGRQPSNLWESLIHLGLAFKLFQGTFSSLSRVSSTSTLGIIQPCF